MVSNYEPLGCWGNVSGLLLGGTSMLVVVASTAAYPLLRGRTALKELRLANNELTGGLGPLRSCTSLQWLELGHKQLTGGLEPLRGCTALAALELEGNQLTGSLEPLQGCVALQCLALSDNELTGGLEPLRGCKKAGGASPPEEQVDWRPRAPQRLIARHCSGSTAETIN
jgi:hypothetical protein